MKTILEIAKSLVPDISIAAPLSLASSQEQADIDLLRCINEAGNELQSRFDWPQLRKKDVLLGPGALPINLPADYSRMVKGWSVTSSGVNVRGSLSDEEFNRLTPVAGVPRYYRSSTSTLELWPYITAPSTVSILYITKNWLAGDKQFITDDTDVPLIDDQLLEKGALWRFLRMKGEDFTDQLAEFEAALKRYSSFSRSERLP